MSSFLYFACIFGILSCNKPLTSGDDHPFEILEATSQEWVAGARGGGRGINYKIIIRITTSMSNLSFDSIWIHNKKLQLTIEKGDRRQPSIQLNKNDTLTLLASDYSGRTPVTGRRQEETNPAVTGSVQAPIAYEGAALLRYLVEDAQKFFVLPQVKPLPPIYGH